MGSFSCSSALTSLNTMHLKHIYESARLKSHRVHSNCKPFKNIFLCFKALDKYEKAVKKTVQAGMQVFKTFLTCLGVLVFKILSFLISREGHGHRKAVETYNASQRKWVDDMVSACSVCLFLQKTQENSEQFVVSRCCIIVVSYLEVRKYTRKNAHVVTNLQQTCSNAVPTTCQQDVFALLVPSLLTSCQRLVENLLQGC